MPKYVFAYHGGGMADTPEAQAEAMAAWGAWFGELGAAVLDGGNPAGQSKTVRVERIGDGWRRIQPGVGLQPDFGEGHRRRHCARQRLPDSGRRRFSRGGRSRGDVAPPASRAPAGPPGPVAVSVTAVAVH